jgi:hypothetical protein
VKKEISEWQRIEKLGSGAKAQILFKGENREKSSEHEYRKIGRQI